MTRRPAAKLEWLEGMRGLAALWVACHHGVLAVRRPLDLRDAPHALANGSLGVDFFFVLSGFIIAYSSEHLARAGGTLRDYALARAVRVYVPYLPVGLLMLAIYWGLRLFASSSPHTSTLSSITLLPAEDPPALVVAWTLVHEVLFYAVFSLYFVHRGVLWLTLCAWALGIAFVALAGVPLTHFAEYLLSPVNLGFLAGVLAFQVSKRWRPPRLVSPVLGAAGIVAVAIEAGHAGPDRVIVTLGFVALVMAVAVASSPRREPLPLLGALGAASYSVYLVHKPVELLVAGLIAPAFRGNWAGFVLVVVVSVLVGLAYYRFYERPALVRARAWVSGVSGA